MNQQTVQSSRSEENMDFFQRKQLFNTKSLHKHLYHIVLFLLLFSMANSSFANDYYLAPGGDDTASGDINNPWATISKANAVLVPGDTVYFRAGTYQDVIYPSNSGLEGAKITYKGYQDEEAIITGIPNEPGVVFLGYNPNTNDWSSRSYIVVENLSIINNDLTSTCNIQIYGPETHHIEIRNVNIVRADTETEIYTSWEAGHRENGISLSKAHHVIIEDCHISGLTKIGIIMGSGAHHNIIRNNSITNTFHNCIDIGNGNYTYQGTLIEDNYLCGSLTSDGIQFEPDYDAIPAEDDSSNQGVIIRNNTICHNAENALDLKGTCKIVIEGNLIFGNTGDNNGYVFTLPYDADNNMTYNDQTGGGAITHGASTKSKEIIIRGNFIYDNSSGITVEKGYKIYNNVILNNARTWAGSNSTDTSLRRPPHSGLSYLGTLTGVPSALKNNIIGDHPVSEINLWTGNEYNLEINNNIYYNFDQLSFCEYRDKYDWDLLSFSQWQVLLQGITGISGYESNSFVVNGPADIFVNVPSRPVDATQREDYKLRSLSAAIDKGGFLTFAIGDGSGTEITLNDVGYFHNGFDIIEGDTIQFDGQWQTAKITDIDYTTNTITVDTALTWSNNQKIGLAYIDKAPDIGAFEGDMSGYWKFDEVGNIASDASGNGNAGTLINNPVRVSGLFGNALEFDGISSHVNCGPVPQVDFANGSFSVSLWINADAVQTHNNATFFSKRDASTNDGFSLIVRKSTNIRAYLESGSTQINLYSGVSAIGIWRHVVLVIDRGTLNEARIYVDGVLCGSASIAALGPFINAADVLIGCEPTSGCKSTIDDVRIYNRVLTEDEILLLASQ